jgi:effector-binding domain-containing protein
MLTLPKIVERPSQPYVAVRRQVKIPFGEAIGPAMGEIVAWMAARNLTSSGPPFFKYNLINMPDLEIEFGFPTSALAPADDGVITGAIPAGRYATLSYFGPYDDLIDVTAVLVGWARQTGVEWDSTAGPDGERFAARLEIYANDMNALPPEKWETVLAFKVKGEEHAARR